MHQDKNKKQGETSSGIKVFIRVRPLLQSEKDTAEIVQIQKDSKTLKIYNDQINHIETKFDCVFGQQKTQLEVFHNFQPFVKKLFQGFNLTIFAYGQTGSGKTFTMFGSDWQNYVDKNLMAKKQSIPFSKMEDDMQKAGIIPRSINAVFKQFQHNKGRFQLFCSFLQIYNQKIYDLLQDSPTPKPLSIHESKVNGIFVEGLTQFQVEHFSDCFKLIRQGEKNRFIRETSMNAKSSRSHSIFQVLIQATTSDSQGNYLKARLNLCDLAGSEKIHKGQNLQSDHLQQLKNINLSLTTLGKVINALSSGKKATVAAFRQSKLTRLLQQSLTINTNTFIIGNISPSSKNIDQTINTLKFAQRASHITMKIKPIDFNEMNPDSVTKLKKEIQYLKGLLNQKRQGGDEAEQDEKLNEKKIKNDQLEEGSISQIEFEKLLKENRQMKREIYELQVNLQRIKSETSSNVTSRVNSASSSAHNPIELDSSTHNSFRKQIYLQKFLKQVPPEKTKTRQQKNNSLLTSVGKSTIEVDKTTYNNDKKQLNKNEKLSILQKYQKLQFAKKQNQQSIIQQLQNLKSLSPTGNKKIASVGQGQLKQSTPIRYREANVFRRGKMSVDMGLFEIGRDEKLIQNGEQSGKKKKIDYSDRIRQLEQRLYNK